MSMLPEIRVAFLSFSVRNHAKRFGNFAAHSAEEEDVQVIAHAMLRDRDRPLGVIVLVLKLSRFSDECSALQNTLYFSKEIFPGRPTRVKSLQFVPTNLDVSNHEG